MKTITYVKNFIKDKNIGSITPTSKFAIRKLCSKIDFNKDLNIIEYGPGTGVFTEYILERMSDNSRFVLIEQNSNFCSILNEKFTDKRLSIVNSSAEDVPSIAKKLGMNKADYIISGIPFSFFSECLKDNILKKTNEILNYNGKFLIYQFSNNLLQCLGDYFRIVDSEFILLNIPPLYIIEAEKE